jgi:hypothetical protein
MIRITQGGVIVADNAVASLARAYADTGLALLPGFLTPPVLNALLARVEKGTFRHKREEAVRGSTLLMPQNDPALVSLHFMVNRPELFDVVSGITGLPRPGNFTSRLHRTLPAPDLHLDWHDDGLDYRILGLNINLSTTPYQGGLFQMRNPAQEITATVGQLNPGDAFLFRISNRWQHRLTAIESGQRTVAVGWFRTKPDWVGVALAGIRSSVISLEAWG